MKPRSEHPLHPDTETGLAFWLGCFPFAFAIIAVGLFVLIVEIA